jgi:hypothetical protein
MNSMALALAAVSKSGWRDELPFFYIALLFAAVPLLVLGLASSDPHVIFFGIIQAVVLVYALRFTWRSIGAKSGRTDWPAVFAMFLIYFPLCLFTNGICMVLAICLRGLI